MSIDTERVGPAVDTFLHVLRACWTELGSLASRLEERQSEFLSDWMQATWESVVEASVASGSRTFIEPYGDGADCNTTGSRVWMPGVESTHAVCCVARQGGSVKDVLTGERVELNEGWPVDRFVSRTGDGWYREELPFDHVLVLADGGEAVFDLNEVRFILRALGSSPSS